MACVAGLTNGIYSYTDCCGVFQTGISLGQSICIDEAYSGSSVGVYILTGQTCTQSCNPGILGYSFSVTGTCLNASGATEITGVGGVPPYTVDDVIPGVHPTQTGSGPLLFTGLTGGTYVFRINDSLGLQNNERFINVIISECFVADVAQTIDTICGEDNGEITISATTNASPYTIILYKDGALYDIKNTPTLPYNFTNLSAGTYYATMFDYGSVSANTPNTIVYGSTGVDFGLWKVNTSNCVINSGKLAVTGATGTGPFTYLWSNGETTQLISGLTLGTYSCTVTDSLGCSKTLTETIGQADPLGLVSYTPTNPSCFASDGSLTYTISGGTSPYYFSANTSQVGYTLSNTFTLNSLSSGNYSLFVRDANFCQLDLTGSLSTQNGFNLSSINVTNSVCNQNNGAVTVQIEGVGSQNYLFILSSQTGTNVYSTLNSNQTFTQTGLSNGVYDLLISGTGSPCVYTNTVTINSQQKFTITATTTGSTCGSPNGTLQVEVGTGYTGNLTYVLENNDSPFINDSVLPNGLSAETFNNLISGNYTISVIDSDGCAVSETFVISSTANVDFAISYTDCTGNNDGSATVTIFQGEPPFTYLWSNGGTGTSVNNLSGGTYSLTITDNNDCVVTNYFNITCLGQEISSYGIFSVCSNTFTTTSGNKRGLLQMFSEGFMDITSGYTGCTLNSADLNCTITINGSAFTETFANITSIDDIPQDTLWVEAINSILSGTSVVGSYTIDQLTNQIRILSNCSGSYDPIGDGDYKLELSIDYDVTCTGTGSTVSGFTCCSPTITDVEYLGSGLYGVSFDNNCGPCISTSIAYSTNSGATWSSGINGNCNNYRVVPTIATSGVVYFKMVKKCSSTLTSGQSVIYIFTP